jgi:hypothetical protein
VRLLEPQPRTEATEGQRCPITGTAAPCWASETELIGWLVRAHGWRMQEIGVLRRSWRK